MRITLLLCLLSLVSVSHAQEFEPSGYLGLGFGSFSYEESDVGFGSFSDSASGMKLYGGYNLSERWGVEASYQQTGTVEESVSQVIPGVGTLSARVGAEFSAITVRAMGYLPFSWGTLFGGAGYYDGDSDVFAELDDGINPVVRVDASGSESGLTVVGGAQWDFLSSLSLRAEYEWWDAGGDASQLGLALQYKF